MAAQGVPLQFSEALNLQQLGVPQASIKHGLTSMESDRWIVCVEPNQVTMVDLQNGAQVTRRPIQAEAAVMNPSSNILEVDESYQSCTCYGHGCLPLGLGRCQSPCQDV